MKKPENMTHAELLADHKRLTKELDNLRDAGNALYNYALGEAHRHLHLPVGRG